MKTPVPFPAPFKFCSLLFVLLALTFAAAAQDVHYRDPQDPGKGYWKLFTDAATRTTRVKFFDAQNHLLYEEELPGKYIRLTDRNINRINQTFDQVTRNNLVVSNVKANSLPAEATDKPFNQAKVNHPGAGQASHAAPVMAGTNIKLNTFKVPNSTKFYVVFENPDRERIKIYLQNEAKQVLYDDNVNQASYKRRYDFAGLHAGQYTLVVSTVNRKFRYTEQISVGPTSQTWQPEQPEQPLPALITQTK